MSKALISFFQHGVMHKDAETFKSGLYVALLSAFRIYHLAVN